jgi:hypothetical protein
LQLPPGILPANYKPDEKDIIGRAIEIKSAQRGSSVNTKNLLIVCVTLLLAGVLFWPTLYRYNKIDVQGLPTLVRINRLTGYTEHLMLGQWVRVTEKEKKKQMQSQPLTPAERALFVIGKASLAAKMLNGEVYNGSTKTITSITFRVIAKEKSGNIRWDRKFKETIRLNPFTTSYFAVTITETEGIGSFDWSLDEVLGYKAK